MPRKLSLKQTVFVKNPLKATDEFVSHFQKYLLATTVSVMILALVDIPFFLTEGIMLTEAIRILAVLTLNGRVLHCMHAEKSFCCEK
jgi:hypothetical protein